MLVSAVCKVCGVAFTKQASKSKAGAVKYCSKKCAYGDRKNIGLGGWKLSETTKKKMSVKRKSLFKEGKISQKGEKHPSWKGGIPKCCDCGKQLVSYKATRCGSCSRKGSNNARWDGGKTKLHDSIRNLSQYFTWRLSIFQRDRFECQICGDNTGGNLEAHHKVRLNNIIKEYEIKSQKDAETCYLLWDISNGITVCNKCHKTLHRKEIR